MCEDGQTEVMVAMETGFDLNVRTGMDGASCRNSEEANVEKDGSHEWQVGVELSSGLVS